MMLLFLLLLLLLLLFFFFYCSDYCLFCCSPAYAFSGRPLAGRAVVNGASGAVSALAGFHPDAKPRLAATVPVAPPLSRRLCRAVA